MPKMRPYTGIGLLLLKKPAAGQESAAESLYLYEEPGISRSIELKPGLVPPHSWIFGSDPALFPLFVMNRKGNWLEVSYDEAGREAWLNPGRQGVFKSWQAFLKGKTGHLLPGLQKRHYQFLPQHPGGTRTTISSRERFKIIRAEKERILVMLNQQALGWLSWRDEDGRLLIGVDSLTVP